jgi:hypothetical protein
VAQLLLLSLVVLPTPALAAFEPLELAGEELDAQGDEFAGEELQPSLRSSAGGIFHAAPTLGLEAPLDGRPPDERSEQPSPAARAGPPRRSFLEPTVSVRAKPAPRG